MAEKKPAVAAPVGSFCIANLLIFAVAAAAAAAAAAAVVVVFALVVALAAVLAVAMLEKEVPGAFAVACLVFV